jgi:hypothetical protein
MAASGQTQGNDAIELCASGTSLRAISETLKYDNIS